MVDSIRSAGNTQLIQQLNKTQSARSEGRKTEKAEQAPSLPNATELSEEQALKTAQSSGEALLDNQDLTLGKGKVLDAFL